MRTREEIINSSTHFAGMIAALAGGTVLIVLNAMHGSARLIVGTCIFVATLILLYTASTLYHFSLREAVKRRLKVLDHSAIYLLIAGTYTPFTLAGLSGGWGWSLFGIIWGLALCGVVFKLFFIGRFEILSTVVYIAMGWLVIIAIRPMMHALATPTLLWLVAGGLTYTAGTIFYLLDSRPYMHGVWHLFVLGGSVCHALAVATL